MARKRKKPRRRKYSPFRESLKNLGYDSYNEYLASDHWQALKERYRASQRPQKCLCCGSEKYELHHTTYERLGREWLKDLIPLCRQHHEDYHQYLKDDPTLELGDVEIILEGIKRKTRNCSGL